MTEETKIGGIETEEEHWHPPYWRIFVILLALTAIEMGLAIFPGPKWMAVSLMIVIAIVKIAYIARYFMHLKFDQKVLGAIACAPLLFASCMIFYLLLEFS